MKNIFIETDGTYVPARRVQRTSHGTTHCLVDGCQIEVPSYRVMTANPGPNVRHKHYDPLERMKREAQFLTPQPIARLHEKPTAVIDAYRSVVRALLARWILFGY